MSEKRRFYAHTKVRETPRDGNSADVSNLSETGSISAVRKKEAPGTSALGSDTDMGRHSKFEIRERKETKIGRDIIEYEVDTDDEDDARRDAITRYANQTYAKSVEDGYLSGSEASVGGAVQTRASRQLGEKSVRYNWEKIGASGPGSRDVAVQMQTTYVIPKEKYLSLRRDVATQTRLRGNMVLQNPRITSDYQMERLRLLLSNENYVFDKDRGRLYRVTTRRTVIDSESDSISTITEESESDTVTVSDRFDTGTGTIVSDSEIVQTYESNTPLSSPRYVSDSGPKPGTRSVAVQMSTKLIVQKEGLPPVKVRDVTIQTKLSYPDHTYLVKRPYSKMIEEIWNNKVPFYPKRPLSPAEASILHTIGIDPVRRSSLPLILPTPPDTGTLVSSPRSQRTKSPRHGRKASSNPSSPRLIPYVYADEAETQLLYKAPGDMGVAPSDTDLEVIETEPPKHRERSPKFPKHDKNRLHEIPVIDASYRDPNDTDNTDDQNDVDSSRYNTRSPKIPHDGDRDAPSSAIPVKDASYHDPDSAYSTDHPKDAKTHKHRNKHRKRSPKVPKGDISTPSTVSVTNTTSHTDGPEDADSPLPVQEVEVIYIDKKHKKYDKNLENQTDTAKIITRHIQEELISEPDVLQPEVVKFEDREDYDLSETILSRPRRRRKLKRQMKMPPGPSYLIRVGGGWMKEEHHRIQHKPLSRKMTPTADGLPFLKTAYVHSYSKEPVIVKHKRDTERRYASFIP